METEVVYIKPVNTCNLSCAHCFTSGRNGDKSKWDFDSLRPWMEDLFEHSPDVHVELHGGEPFLAPEEELYSFGEYVRSNGASLGCTSNLTLPLTPLRLKFIKELLRNRIGTSWEIGSNRFSNKKIFDRWKSNVKLLLERGTTIKLNVSITSELLVIRPEDFLSLITSFGVQEVALERLTKNGSAIDNEDCFPNPETQDKWATELFKLYKKTKPAFAINTFDTLEERIHRGQLKADTHCRNCEQKMFTISADGKVSGCPNGAVTETYTNLAEGYEKALNHPDRVTLMARELSIDPRCFSCDVFDLCGGDCWRLPWSGNRCGGYKYLIRHISGRDLTISIRVE